MKKILTIAGSDCSGGAGIQADLKTISSHNMYGMSVITALTAQNTLGVNSIENVDVQMVIDQIDAVFTDIKPDAVKIGMVSNKDIIMAICERLKFYNCKNIVYDPVMVSTSGDKLIEDDTVDVIIKNLLPLATIITPNIYEATVLANMKVDTDEDIEKAIIKIKEIYKGSILIKGGHLKDNCNDILFDNEIIHKIKGKRIDNKNTHGTGCTLSSAIACNIADNQSMFESVYNAKVFITSAIDKMLDLGKGRGPLNHFVNVTNNKLYRNLIKDNELTWERYTNHVIKDALIYNEIKLDKFKEYIKQDYLYIISFKKYAQILFDEFGIQIFMDIVNSCDEEHLLHKKYVEVIKDIKPSKETKDYIDYIDEIFSNGSFEDKVIALAPCFIGYAEFGKNICTHNISDDNPYIEWIQAYNSDSYTDKTNEYIELINSFELTDNFYRFSKIFKDVTNLEVCFFNQML